MAVVGLVAILCQPPLVARLPEIFSRTLSSLGGSPAAAGAAGSLSGCRDQPASPPASFWAGPPARHSAITLGGVAAGTAGQRGQATARPAFTGEPRAPGI